MIELSDSARQRFDDYLRRLRRTLRGSQAYDVEQSVREHVEIALAGIPAPVGAEHLGTVLERLGPPERWVPEEELPIWRRVMMRISNGPDDWRLAYLSFGLFFLTVVLLPAGIGLLFLVPAYLVSRAFIELLSGRSEPIGARRWLVYPAIVAVVIPALLFFLIGPAAPVVAWGVEQGGFHRLQPAMERMEANVATSAMVFGAWWVLGSAIVAIFFRPIRFLFAPVLDRLRRRHLWFLFAAGAISLGAGIALLYV